MNYTYILWMVYGQMGVNGLHDGLQRVLEQGIWKRLNLFLIRT